MAPKAKDEKPPKKGDKLQAKWSGSNVFYPATVLDTSGKQCKVKFDDGSILSVKLSDTKPLKSEKGEAKKKGRTRSRSSSAGRKPRSRSRSPSRKSSAERKTPPRKVKSSNALLQSARSSTPSKSKEKESPETSKSSTVLVNSITEKFKSEKVVLRDVYEKDIKGKDVAHLRTSARIAALQLPRTTTRTPEPSDKKGKRTSKAQYSDEEDDEESEDEEETKTRFSYLSFTAVILKMVLLPMLVLFLCFACAKTQCALLERPQMYSRWAEFGNDIKYPLLSCLSFHLLILMLSKIPLGKEAKGFPVGAKGVTKMYRINGFYLLLVAMLTFGILTYFKFYMNWGFDKIKPLVISSLIYTVIWSFIMHFIALYKKSSASDLKSNRKSGFLGNFYYGHEINPVLTFGEDVKTWFIHFGLIGLVLVDLSILVKFFLMKNYVTYPLALAAFMQIFFVLDYFWREEAMLSTATFTDDGVGYGFIVGIGSIIPCTFAMQLVFLKNNAAKATATPLWCSAAILALYFIGYAIYLYSSRMKHIYRRNPFSSSTSSLKSIPTSKKKRLILAGAWGFVRHPNYIGLILMTLACSLSCGFSHALPYTPFALILVTLCNRLFKVEAACKEKYGPAWKNYTDKVRSRLIPYVF